MNERYLFRLSCLPLSLIVFSSLLWTGDVPRQATRSTVRYVATSIASIATAMATSWKESTVEVLKTPMPYTQEALKIHPVSQQASPTTSSEHKAQHRGLEGSTRTNFYDTDLQEPRDRAEALARKQSNENKIAEDQWKSLKAENRKRGIKLKGPYMMDQGWTIEKYRAHLDAGGDPNENLSKKIVHTVSTGLVMHTQKAKATTTQTTKVETSGGGGSQLPPKKDDDEEKIPFDEKRVGHSFRKADGHFDQDTPENRAIVQETVKNVHFEGTLHGNDHYSRELPNGRQVWVRVRDGKIFNCGINSRVLPKDPKTGLSMTPGREKVLNNSEKLGIWGMLGSFWSSSEAAEAPVTQTRARDALQTKLDLPEPPKAHDSLDELPEPPARTLSFYEPIQIDKATMKLATKPAAEIVREMEQKIGLQSPVLPKAVETPVKTTVSVPEAPYRCAKHSVNYKSSGNNTSSTSLSDGSSDRVYKSSKTSSADNLRLWSPSSSSSSHSERMSEATAIYNKAMSYSAGYKK